MNILRIYCDGGCRDNQSKNNIGGWGYRLEFGEHVKEDCGGKRNTTNNIMELIACIEALKAINDYSHPTEVTTDSNYLVQGINSWMTGWKKKGWKTAKGAPVKNVELWKELDELKSKFSNIKFIHCYGHGTNEGNNRADALANEGMDKVI